MDMIKIGEFLASLRKEKGLTQSELGDKIGVTNKTISRWETGEYLPPVEMLEQLSNLYGLTINEIISAKKLNDNEYKEMAEKNIKSTLNASAFTIKEKEKFLKKKWLKEHIALLIMLSILFLGTTITSIILDNSLLCSLSVLIVICSYGYIRNKMMIFVESVLYPIEK